MSAFQLAALIGAALAAPCVVAARDPRHQVVVLSVFGVILSILFLAFQAPDVAISQLAAGVVLVPLIIVLALAKIRELELEEERDGEQRDEAARDDARTANRHGPDQAGDDA